MNDDPPHTSVVVSMHKEILYNTFSIFGKEKGKAFPPYYFLFLSIFFISPCDLLLLLLSGNNSSSPDRSFHNFRTLESTKRRF